MYYFIYEPKSTAMCCDETGIPRHWYLGISPQDQETADEQQQPVQTSSDAQIDALGVEHELKLRHSPLLQDKKS